MAAVTATLEAIENDRMLANVKTVEAHHGGDSRRLRQVQACAAVVFCWAWFREKAARFTRPSDRRISQAPQAIRRCCDYYRRYAERNEVDLFVETLLAVTHERQRKLLVGVSVSRF